MFYYIISHLLLTTLSGMQFFSLFCKWGTWSPEWLGEVLAWDLVGCTWQLQGQNPHRGAAVPRHFPRRCSQTQPLLWRKLGNWEWWGDSRASSKPSWEAGMERVEMLLKFWLRLLLWSPLKPGCSRHSCHSRDSQVVTPCYLPWNECSDIPFLYQPDVL